MRFFSAFTALLALLCLAPGCTPSRKTVGISVLTTTNPFFKEIADVFSAEMGKHGYDVVVVSGENDQARQKSQGEDFLAKRVSAIVLCPCNSQTVGEAIR